jgi:hypothetical protein
VLQHTDPHKVPLVELEFLLLTLVLNEIEKGAIYLLPRIHRNNVLHHIDPHKVPFLELGLI